MLSLLGIRKYFWDAGLLAILAVMVLMTSSAAYAKRSPEEVFHYQKHMAQAGYSSAIYKLAVMYQNGYGTPRNLLKALALYKESFQLGYTKAEGRVKEVELLIQSGEYESENKNNRVSDEQAARAKQLQAEREKLQKERVAYERSKRQAREASLAEQQKLNKELTKLRLEKESFEKEKRRLKAQKELAKWRQAESAMEEDE